MTGTKMFYCLLIFIRWLVTGWWKSPFFINVTKTCLELSNNVSAVFCLDTENKMYNKPNCHKVEREMFLNRCRTGSIGFTKLENASPTSYSSLDRGETCPEHQRDSDELLHVFIWITVDDYYHYYCYCYYYYISTSFHFVVPNKEYFNLPEVSLCVEVIITSHSVYFKASVFDATGACCSLASGHLHVTARNHLFVFLMWFHKILCIWQKFFISAWREQGGWRWAGLLCFWMMELQLITCGGRLMQWGCSFIVDRMSASWTGG